MSARRFRQICSDSSGWSIAALSETGFGLGVYGLGDFHRTYFITATHRALSKTDGRHHRAAKTVSGHWMSSEPSQVSDCARRTFYVGALIIIIGFWGPLYYNYNKAAPKQCKYLLRPLYC